jgi:hypothetical protein
VLSRLRPENSGLVARAGALTLASWRTPDDILARAEKATNLKK